MIPKTRLKPWLSVISLLVIGTSIAYGDTPAIQKWVAPYSAAVKENPVPRTKRSINLGKQIYTANCVSCHGLSGKGDGMLAASLPHKPADLDQAEVWQQTDGALFWKITAGRQPMPSWASLLSEDERWSVIDYMRSFFAPAGVVALTPVEEKAAQGATKADVDQLQRDMAALQAQVKFALPGTEHFFFAGDAFVNFAALHGTTNTFSAGVSPMILFRPNDYMLIESSFDLGLNTDPDTSSSTSIDLTIAEASFFLNDWLTVGGGVFVTPFGAYHNHFDPSWIYKFADDPLPFGDGGIAPGSAMGLFARGAQLIGGSKIVYDAYVINGPNLVTSDPTAAGTLQFDDWSALNNGKSVGGRLGFLPIPEMEMGYSILYGKVNPNGAFPGTRALLQAVDFNYRPDVAALMGTFEFRTEWVWSDVQRQTYDPAGSLGFGPLSYTNYRDGGYVQLSYRPTHESSEILRNFELCGRWEFQKVPEIAPGGGEEQRYTIGLNYWINPQTVLKCDYEWDRRTASLGPEQSGVQIQLGLGL